MTGAPTHAAQADAVERITLSQRAHVANLHELAGKKKRPQEEADMAAEWLPALEAAAVTMRRVANLPPGVLKAAVEAHRNALADKSKGAA